MASLSRYRKGWSIQWRDEKGRRTFYPGQMTKKQAESVRVQLEALITSKKARTSLPDATASWVAGVDLTMRQKLHTLGLIEKPEETTSVVVTLGAFVDRYISSRSSAKASTATVWKRCRRHLVTFFGDGRALDSIGVGDAKDFRQWMLSDGRGHGKGGLSENTVRKMCSIAAQIFTDAIDREIVARNPFTNKEIPRTTRENRQRDYFVSREVASAVLEACPDVEWRLLFALSRYGGLRCPSEHLSLRWRDVLWESDRILVTAPKTEHHEGKGTRLVPIFPELRPLLQEAFEAAEPGSEFVISRCRSRNVNLRPQLERIVTMAGIEPWPKLFHNLRASRETELAAEHPLHVVCSWIGNSPVVAAKHYLQVTEEDFTKAATGKCTAKSTAEGDRIKPKQSENATSRNSRRGVLTSKIG